MIKALNFKVHLAGNQVCMKRGLDADRIRRYLLANGCELVETPDGADIILALTCAFISSYSQTAARMIEKLKQYPAKLVMLGCLPAMAPDLARSVFDGPTLLTRDLDQIDRLFPGFTIPFASIPDGNFPDTAVMQTFDPDTPCPIGIRNNVSGKKRAGPFIRIAWGCRNNCSYCSHPAALGPLKSKALDICVQEYKALLKEGHQLVTIHANDPGAYGQDIGLSYPALLERLDNETPTPAIKWSLCDVNPTWLIKHRDGLLPFFRKGRICHLGVPLQSGSPAILKRMRRDSRVDEIIGTLKAFREADAKFSLTSHLILGFPGETDEDRNLTFAVVCQAQIQRVYLFPFSANPDTPASRMEGQHSREAITAFMKSFSDRLSAASIPADVFA